MEISKADAEKMTAREQTHASGVFGQGIGSVGYPHPSSAQHEKQYAEEQRYRQEQDVRHIRAAALEAAIRILTSEYGNPNEVLQYANLFECFLNGSRTPAPEAPSQIEEDASASDTGLQQVEAVA